MKFLLVRIIIQFAYVNTVIFSGIQVYYMLPRIFNAVMVFFAIPIFLIFVFKYIGQLLIKILKEDKVDEDLLIVPLGISAVTLWLALLASLADFTGAGYINLIKKQFFKNVTVSQAHNYSSAGYISFSDGNIAVDFHGAVHQTTKKKSGDSYSRTRHSYYAYPIVTAGWTKEQPVNAWLCESLSNSLSVSFKDQEKPRIPKLKLDVIQGVPVHDPYDIRDYSKAIENAITKHGLKVHPEYLLMNNNELSYESLIELWRFRFIIFMSIVNLLWVGIPGFLMVNDYRTGLKLSDY